MEREERECEERKKKSVRREYMHLVKKRKSVRKEHIRRCEERVLCEVVIMM